MAKNYNWFQLKLETTAMKSVNQKFTSAALLFLLQFQHLENNQKSIWTSKLNYNTIDMAYRAMIWLLCWILNNEEEKQRFYWIIISSLLPKRERV